MAREISEAEKIWNKFKYLERCPVPEGIIVKTVYGGEIEVPIDRETWNWISAILNVYAEKHYAPREVWSDGT